MQMFSNHTAGVKTRQQNLPDTGEAPRTLAPEALAFVAGGLNPQPLPPFHEPEAFKF
jgi:hypothetical protein